MSPPNGFINNPFPCRLSKCHIKPPLVARLALALSSPSASETPT